MAPELVAWGGVDSADSGPGASVDCGADVNWGSGGGGKEMNNIFVFLLFSYYSLTLLIKLHM